MALQFNHLNSHQREAVLHFSGPLLILAGAGSGKTSTMAYRMAYLMAEKGVRADSILGLSFTNKAAQELKQRVTHLVSENMGRSKTYGLTITTFHSLCARVLRKNAEHLGFQSNFTIVDQNDQKDILKQVLRNIKIDDRKFDPDLILFEMGQAKNRFLRKESAEAFFLESGRLSQDYAIAAASAYGKYQDQLRILNAMDFDDLIFHTVDLLENHSEVREYYNAVFQHILVDEYQDTNAAQFKILRLLTQRQQNICVVGDDDQSIYSWRGADPTHILGFDKQYPAARVIALEQNYRSTSRILEAANAVIAGNKTRYAKKLWSERGVGEPLMEIVVEEDRAESEFVAEEILRRTAESGRAYSDFVILYRSNAQSRVFEEALRRRAIPYKIVGGLSFLARKEVKDVLAYWKVIVNPKDDASLRRILNWPARGIGKTSIEALSTYAFESKISLFEALNEAPARAPKAAAAIRSFREMIIELGYELSTLGCEATAVAQWAQQSLVKIQAKKAVEEDCDDGVQAAKKWENVEELVHSLGQFKVDVSALEPVNQERGVAQDRGIGMSTLSGEPLTAPNLEGLLPNTTAPTAPREGGPFFLREFLNRMALEAQETEKDQEKEKDQTGKNQVTLLTLHGAKGLEYPIVFMVGMEDGFLPHRRTIDEGTDLSEERRLCYVGITRAKDFLFLIRAKNRIRYGKPVPRCPSRFLAEIPADLMVRTDESASPSPSTQQAQEEHEVRVKNYLAEIRANLMKKK